MNYDGMICKGAAGTAASEIARYGDVINRAAGAYAPAL